MTRGKRGFTLIELLIVLVIIGILAVILLRTYTLITQIVFRVQQTRNVHQEVLRVSQIFQNFADDTTIDFSAYTGLREKQGIVSTLSLVGQDRKMSFYMTGDCAVPANSVLTGKCWIEMIQSGEIIPLTQTTRVNIRNLVFKIIPFASEAFYLSGSAMCDQDDYLHCIHKPGFRVLFDAYSINYGSQWTNRVHIPLQLFY